MYEMPNAGWLWPATVLAQHQATHVGGSHTPPVDRVPRGSGSPASHSGLCGVISRHAPLWQQVQVRHRGSASREPRRLGEAIVEGASRSGVFGTTRRTVFALAISWLFAGNPASPQSVPSSVLLNFFMTGSDGRESFPIRRCRRTAVCAENLDSDVLVM
jgi:hypothetical protein